MQYETLEVKSDGSIDWLSLNRPQNLNAITPQMCDELQDYFLKLQDKHTTRIVIFKGNGKHFCAGYDINDTAGVSAGPVSGMRFQRQVSEVILRMRYCPQPIINLSHGAATGGGLAFALASDVRIAAENVKFNVAMVKIGLTGCDVGISYFLPRAVGSSMAAEMMMTGRMITSERALSSGLVSEIVDISALEEAGKRLADEMLSTSPLGLRLTKEGLRLTTDAPSLEAAIALEDRGQILCASAGFFDEGINAFLQKRPASYPD